jgi:hypothetical protein
MNRRKGRRRAGGRAGGRAKARTFNFFSHNQFELRINLDFSHIFITYNIQFGSKSCNGCISDKRSKGNSSVSIQWSIIVKLNIQQVDDSIINSRNRIVKEIQNGV